MIMPLIRSRGSIFCSVLILAGTVSILRVAPMAAETPGEAVAAADAKTSLPVAPCETAELGSPYIPLDSWMYPSLTRLYSLGYLDLAFLGLRPWTRSSVIHMLEDTN